jgi:hypothetical protein
MLDKDPSNWLDLIPFMLRAGQTQKLSMQRIAEAVIIAGITAGVVMYSTQQVIAERLEGVRKDVQRVEQKVNVVDSKVERIRSDLYAPVLESR